MMNSGVRIVCGLLLALCSAAPASAQLSVFTTTPGPTGVTFGDSAAYDPVHDVYLVATGTSQVTGRFVNRSGATIGTVLIDTRRGGNVRVVYCPDVNDGLGGTGGFVVVWGVYSANGLFARVVSFAGGPVGHITQVFADVSPVYNNFVGLAYSPTDHILFVGIDAVGARIIRLDLNVQPIDVVPLADPPLGYCPAFEFFYTCDKVDVVWNPVSGEFGVVYSQGLGGTPFPHGQRVFARVSGSGVVLSRTPLAIGLFYGALAVNPATGTYVAIGAEDVTLAPPFPTDGAVISRNGTVLTQRVITSSLATFAGYNLMDLSYATASGTLVLAGSDAINPGQNLRLLELNPNDLSTVSTLTNIWSPWAIAAHATAAEWLVYSSGGTYVIRSATRLCATPDPFVALGGGTCFNGGWLPPGISPPPPVACTGPDPFLALGGGHCVNGGWLPPEIPTVPAPPPPPALPPVPGSCLTPDPFAALGGGTCVNGGWIPPTMTLPPPPPTACLTPDPFVAIGGGVCIGGGWRPRG